MKGLFMFSFVIIDSVIWWVFKVIIDVVNFCVEKIFVSEVFVVEVFCVLEVVGCDGVVLGVVWDGIRCSGGVGWIDDGKVGGWGEGMGKVFKKVVERYDCGEEGCCDK